MANKKLNEEAIQATLGASDHVLTVTAAGAIVRVPSTEFAATAGAADEFTELVGTTWNVETQGTKKAVSLTADTSLTISNYPDNFVGLLFVEQTGVMGFTLTVNGSLLDIREDADTMIAVIYNSFKARFEYYADAGSAASGGGSLPAGAVIYDPTTLVNFNLASGILTKTGTSGFNAIAASTQGIGATADTYKGGVEFTVTAGWSSDILFGFDSDAGKTHPIAYTDRDFALYIQASKVVTGYHKGATLGPFASCSDGDVFRIEAHTGEIRFIKNATLFHTITDGAITYPLYFSVDAFQVGAVVPVVEIDAANLVTVTYP